MFDCLKKYLKLYVSYEKLGGQLKQLEEKLEIASKQLDFWKGIATALIVEKHKKNIHFNFVVGSPILKIPGGDNMLTLQCTNEEKILITVNPVTASGKAAPIQAGSLTVVVNSGTGTAVIVDEKSFYVVSGDIAEDVSFGISADADLGDGVTTIADEIVLSVKVAEATALGLAASSPEPK